MRSTWPFATFAIVAGISFIACAQSVADDGIFDVDTGGPDPTVDADVGDVTHHDYGSHDGGDAGGGNAGDTGTSFNDASAPSDSGGKDAGGGGHDSGGGTPDTGTPDTGAPDAAPPPTGGTACGSGAKYVLEALAAALDPNAVVCTDGSECSTSQCCAGGLCVGL